MDSLIFIITMLFLVAGHRLRHGRRDAHRQHRRRSTAITKTFAGLGGLIFLLLLISQFIAFFNYSNMPTVAAVKMADLLESADIGALLLLVGFIAGDRDPRHDHARASSRSGRSSRPIFVPLFCASASRRRPCWPPTASATRR